jgi:hypothetical protein
MTPKVAKSENTPAPDPLMDENRELTPNELSAIHGGGPQESVSLNFAKVEFKYTAQKAD